MTNALFNGENLPAHHTSSVVIFTATTVLLLPPQFQIFFFFLCMRTELDRACSVRIMPPTNIHQMDKSMWAPKHDTYVIVTSYLKTMGITMLL